MRNSLPPPGHLALLLRMRDGGYAYDTLKDLSTCKERPNLADAEMALAAREDELSMLAVATFGYSTPAVLLAYQRATSDVVRLSAAGNGFAAGTGWCGSVLDLEQAGALLRASPGALGVFASNPRMTPEGLLDLCSGQGPAAIDLRGRLSELYAGLANNPSIPSIVVNGCTSNPPSLAVRSLLSSIAGCPLDTVHAEAICDLLERIWRNFHTGVMLPQSDAQAAISHWFCAADEAHTGSAAFEVRLYLNALSDDSVEPRRGDDMAKRAAAMMRALLWCDEGMIERLYNLDPHAFVIALRHTPVAQFSDQAQSELAHLHKRSTDLDVFFTAQQAIFEDATPDAMLKPLSRGEFRAAARWLDSALRKLAPNLQLSLLRAASDLQESKGVSRTNSFLFAVFGFLVIVQLLLTILVLGDLYHF